jgi:hypothetical protein
LEVLLAHSVHVFGKPDIFMKITEVVSEVFLPTERYRDPRASSIVARVIGCAFMCVDILTMAFEIRRSSEDDLLGIATAWV